MAKDKILQFSDIHICADGNGHQGFPVRDNFAKSLKQGLSDVKPDLVIISGDVAEDNGEVGAYEWVREQLKDLKVPQVVMSGNHDITKTLAKSLNLSLSLSDKLVGKYELNNSVLFYLDSADDEVSLDQMDWLENEVKNCDKTPLLFVHHPPTLVDCAFMDKFYPMKNHAEVWDRLKKIGKIKDIFCGHYHTSRVYKKDGMNVHVCPSTLFQIDTETERFNISDSTPAFFEITVDEDGNVDSKNHQLRD